jgi:hypothetical protein
MQVRSYCDIQEQMNLQVRDKQLVIKTSVGDVKEMDPLYLPV